MSLKEMKMTFIIEKALSLFLEKSISAITIRDIANSIDVGEATIYRYFDNKDNIMNLCANMLEKEVYDKYFISKSNQNGYEMISDFYNNYLIIFKNHPEYFKFINEYDAYLLSKMIKPSTEYEDLINKFHLIFIERYNKGIEDKSIKSIDDIETFYFSTSKALLELCKKEAVGFNIVSTDGFNSSEKIIKRLIDISLKELKGDASK
ncbi:MAG: TetR/AcrR family transcriptional regulator [Acholeplasmatales bacterium]|nr:TetR/AcrR family transcriptional regulator [Acholeplasmatales bacterium]